VKSAGSRIAMTDIGNSAISVQLLKEYRMDFLKFEQSFMQNLGTDQASLITLKYINDICHLAGVKSLVESSDDETLLDTLNTVRIDFMQGNSKDSPGLVIK
jgi:EAL domain-containing protein (putative c-di-GMP-specific phosphodiesterase class I)